MNEENKKIRVAITHGDTNGIGYEVIFKTFSNPEIFELCTPIIYGSPKVAAYHRKMLNIPANFSIINNAAAAYNNRLNLLTCFEEEVRVNIGKPSKEAGTAAFKALERACEDFKEGLFDVLITAPINKKNIQNDNFHFPGHTEYLEDRLGKGQKALMLMVSDKLRVALVTTHLPIRDVAESINKEKIIEKATTLEKSLRRDFRISSPRIAVLSLNPHAGDNSLIGAEEHDIIEPAIEELTREDINAFGPFPADGFFGNGQHHHFDAILAMYHDQGLIPFKTLAQSEGINFTAGLPVVRTSPDHGTAYDIAGLGKADPTSFRQALFTAIDIFRNRTSYDEPLTNPLTKLYHEKHEEEKK